MRMLLVAPLPRSRLVFAKALAATVVGAAQALLLLPLLPVLGVSISAARLLTTAGAILLTALSLASLGMLLASCIRSIENFAVIMNFVVFPMFFLSGALYPASGLPIYLQPAVVVNPLTYGVDLLKHSMLPAAPPGGLGGEFPIGLSILVLTVFTTLALAGSAILFGREEHLGRILLNSAPRRRSAAS